MTAGDPASRAVEGEDPFDVDPFADEENSSLSGSTTAEQTPTAQEPELYYSTVEEFVRDFLCQVYRRHVDGRSHLFWSSRWWESAEAICRLEAIWRAWEYLRLDPATGQSVWWRDHADPHMAVLMSSQGPFGKSTDTSTRDDPLPHSDAPPGLFSGA